MDITTLIAARPTERRRLADWYSELIDASEREGLSVAEVAVRAGVASETIYAWRRRRARTGAAEHPRHGGPRLVRVRVGDGLPSECEHNIAVRLANGRQILVPSGFHPSTLVALVATLEQC